MTTTKLLFVSILGLLLVVPLQAQTSTQSSDMGLNRMRSQMEKMKLQSDQMRTEMEQI